MLRIDHCMAVLATIAVMSCSAEPPSATVASALAPSCQSLDSISTEHKAKIESAASATYQVVGGGARADIGGESRVDIRFAAPPKSECSSIQRTAICFASLADGAAERAEVQAIWAPLIESICASPSIDLVIPPSAASMVPPWPR